MSFNALNKQTKYASAAVMPVQAAAPTAKPTVDARAIDAAFAINPQLRKRVHEAIDQNPGQSTLFGDISTFILSQQPQPTAEPAAKKRRLEEPSSAINSRLLDPSTTPWRSYPGVSFAIPQRKKFALELLDTKDGGIRAVGANGTVDYAIAWGDVDQVFCLPIPDKAKKQHHFIIVPVYGDGVTPLPEGMAVAREPLVWTFEQATGKNVVEGEDPGPAPMAEAIHHCLIQAGTCKEVVFPVVGEFVSATPESHRKGDKAYHVKAHRGSKDGYLFFTAVGILHGFKKPLAFFDFAAVNSISYTAVLRNTFNLIITTPTQEIEFGMLDQADFAGINEYVQRHGMQDTSLADTRRAKKLSVNNLVGKEAGSTGATEAGAEEESELQKAERELQDQQDDEEEDDDFDPGTEGDSEGEGSGSEDEGEGGDCDEGDTVEVEEDCDEGRDAHHRMQH